MKVSQRHLGCGDEEAATAVEGRLARGVVGGAMVSVAMVRGAMVSVAMVSEAR